MLRHVYLGMRPGLIQEGVQDYLSHQSMRCVIRRLHRAEMPIDVCITDDSADVEKFSNLQIPTVLCTDFEARSDVTDAKRKGARACISVWSGFKHLLLAIDCACQGKPYLCPALLEMMCSTNVRENTSDLTPKEADVIHWISMGYSSKQIARKLGMSPNTVETHRRNIKLKINAHKVSELTRYAITRDAIQALHIERTDCEKPSRYST